MYDFHCPNRVHIAPEHVPVPSLSWWDASVAGESKFCYRLHRRSFR